MAKKKKGKMVKRIKKKGEHSSPETSGVQNMNQKYIKRNKLKNDEEVQTLKDIHGAYLHGIDNKKKIDQEYKGKWTDELLQQEVLEYFEYCVETGMKPAKAGLRLWLGIARSTYEDWEKGDRKHGHKSGIIRMANEFMESQYISRLEKYPTGNIFLLKSSHGHSDRQQVEITGGKDVNKEDIADVVSKLGLDSENSK